MRSAGQTLHDPRTGVVARFEATASSTDGPSVAVDLRAPPGGRPPRRRGTLTRVAGFSIRDLIERNKGRELELHARTINPQFVRVLETIGFDRRWERSEGAYLYYADGNPFLDMLGGFGLY